jgi:hypothetical protein
VLPHLFSYIFAEAETNTETPEMNMETDTTGNGHRVNTKRTQKQNNKSITCPDTGASLAISPSAEVGSKSPDVNAHYRKN